MAIAYAEISAGVVPRCTLRNISQWQLTSQFLEIHLGLGKVRRPRCSGTNFASHYFITIHFFLLARQFFFSALFSAARARF
jgi:hypothetical protein